MKGSFITTCTVLLLVASATLQGQRIREEAPPLRERIFFAGNMGLQFGTYTNVQLAPSIGIWVLPRLSFAVGPTYQFYKDPFGKTDIYGPRVFSEFLFVRDLNNIIPIGLSAGIYTHIEYEGLSLRKDFWQNPYETGRFFVHSALAGFGFNQQVGPRSFMTFTILWALNDTGYEIYSNPEIRIGFMF